MTKKKLKKVQKVDNLLTTIKLSEVSGMRRSTIKYYSEIGILPFQQEDRRLIKRFNKKEAIKRLKKIQGLKRRGLTIEEIIKIFKK